MIKKENNASEESVNQTQPKEQTASREKNFSRDNTQRNNMQHGNTRKDFSTNKAGAPRDNAAREGGHKDGNARVFNTSRGGENKEGHANREFKRDNAPRQNYNSYNSSQPRFANKIKAIETPDDIKQDIVRIEKEISLEIDEIKNLRLGL